MDKNIIQLRKNFNIVLNNFPINILQGEEKLVNELDNLFVNDNMDVEEGQKMMKAMEEYLRAKEKLFVQREKLNKQIAILKIL